MPIDRLSRKMKGYACVTFMVPENAVKAYSELDGKVFQGRMLHLLPGKTKKSFSEMAEEGTKTSVFSHKYMCFYFVNPIITLLVKYVFCNLIKLLCKKTTVKADLIFLNSRGLNLQAKTSAEAESTVGLVS